MPVSTRTQKRKQIRKTPSSASSDGSANHAKTATPNSKAKVSQAHESPLINLVAETAGDKFSLILVKPDPSDPQAVASEFEVEYTIEMEVGELGNIISAIYFADMGLGMSGDTAKTTVIVGVWEYFKSADDISGPRKIYPLSHVLLYPKDFSGKKFTVVDAQCKSKADRLIESWKMFGFEQEFGALTKSKAEEALQVKDNDIEKAMGWLCKVLDKPTITTMCRILLGPLFDRWTALLGLIVVALILPAEWVTPNEGANASPSRSFAGCALDWDLNISASPSAAHPDDGDFARGSWCAALSLAFCMARLYSGVNWKMARVEGNKWSKYLHSLWWGQGFVVSGNATFWLGGLVRRRERESHLTSTIPLNAQIHYETIHSRIALVLPCTPGLRFPAGPMMLWLVSSIVAFWRDWFVPCMEACGLAAARTVALVQTLVQLSLVLWNRVVLDCGAGALLPGLLTQGVAGVVTSVEAILTRVFLHGPEFSVFGVPMGFWNLPHDYANQPQLLSHICNRITFNTHTGNFWIDNKAQCQQMIVEKVRGSVAATLGVLLIVAMYSLATHIGPVVQSLCRLAPWSHAQNLWRRSPALVRTVSLVCVCYWALGGAWVIADLHSLIMFLTDLVPRYSLVSACVGSAVLAGVIHVVQSTG